MATVLVTGVGGASGIGAVRALQETTTHDIVGVDMDPEAAGLYLAGAGRSIPPASDDGWAVMMRDVIEQYGVDVVVPTVDEELPLLDALPDDVPVVAPRDDVIAVSLDKYATAQRLEAAGHAVPGTWLASETASIPESAYPLIRKPRRGRGSRGVERVETPAQLDESLAGTARPPDEVLFQEFVGGTEFTTSVVATADDSVLGVVPKEAIEKDGSTVKGVTRDHDAVQESCRAIAETLAPGGPMNVQQIVDEAGRPHTIEINPRFSSTACLTVRAGVNELDMLIRDALGESVAPPTGFDAGVYLLLERLDIADDPNLYFAFVPFMLLGGALRVVEDGTDRAVEVGVTPLVEYPLSSLIISPVIYGTVFLMTLLSLLACVELDRRGVVDSYYRATAGVGVTLVVLTMAYLTIGALTTDYSTLYLSVLISTVAIASLLSCALYWLFENYAPEVNSGTGYIGLLVIWGHAIDGVANVILADWLDAMGVPLTYYPKHPANAFIISTTEAIQPAGLTAAIGTSWPFLFVKLAVASLVVWLFNDEFLAESPRYALLLLIAVTAVGLGPGTRDMLRATFGI